MPKRDAPEETDTGIVHIDAPPGLDQVTLCGLTDWLGSKGGIGHPSKKKVTCWHCRQMATFCQQHRKMPLPPQS